MAEEQALQVEDSPKHIFPVFECEIVSVVVYQDRAEVTREVNAELENGSVEVVIKGLSEHVDSDSIRVEGKGAATITEVTYQEKEVTSKQETNQKRKELEDKLKELNLQMQHLENKRRRHERQKVILDGLADTVKSGGPTPTEKSSQSDFLNPEFLGNVSNFLEFYLKNATHLDEQLSSTQLEVTEVHEEISVARAALGKLGGFGAQTISRESSILLDVHEAGEVTLLISYVVHNAQWTPKYDIRAFSDQDTLKVQYHGMIQQSTGEEWTDAKISLSTATPSVGGTVPELGTMRLQFQEDPIVTKRRSQKSPRGWGLMSDNEDEQPTVFRGFGGPAAFTPAPVPQMMPAVAEVVESTITASFEVARKSTIPSDNTAHKVTIAMFDLKSTFAYECIPKKAAHAFFKAKVTNTSPYAMLAGPANIFLDNNFIAKSDLKAVSPSEEFECSLGVDNGVRVTYKPVHKFRSNSGWMSTWTTTTFHQLIEIKNTHTTPIKITVTDHYPKSNEAKIKVHLIEPALAKEKTEGKNTASLNKDNNIVWDLNMAGSATEEISLKYTVEHPSDKVMDTVVVD